MDTVAVTRRRLGDSSVTAVTERSAHRIEDRSQQRAQDGGVGLLRFVDGLARQAGVVEQHADGRARRADRRARDPAAADDARLALVVLDDRTVLEHGEVRAFLLGPAERLAIRLADVVHDVALVDDLARDVGAPRPQHGVALAIEQEDADALEADALQRQLGGALEHPVRFLQGQDLVERREQRRQLAVDRLIDDLGHGDLRSEDDRPVHAPAPRRHGGSLTPARIAERGSVHS